MFLANRTMSLNGGAEESLLAQQQAPLIRSRPLRLAATALVVVAHSASLAAQRCPAAGRHAQRRAAPRWEPGAGTPHDRGSLWGVGLTVFLWCAVGLLAVIASRSSTGPAAPTSHKRRRGGATGTQRGCGHGPLPDPWRRRGV